MDISGYHSQGSDVLQLPGPLEIYTVLDVRNLLLDAIQQKPAVNLDLSQVKACDAAGLQLLCAARKAAQSAARPLRIVCGSPSVLDACSAIGLDPAELETGS
jgi:phospholipid transport system transporter-binding protein